MQFFFNFLGYGALHQRIEWSNPEMRYINKAVLLLLNEDKIYMAIFIFQFYHQFYSNLT